jgi:hypothetical protein
VHDPAIRATNQQAALNAWEDEGGATVPAPVRILIVDNDRGSAEPIASLDASSLLETPPQ